jgi:hypothetical protein
MIKQPVGQVKAPAPLASETTAADRLAGSTAATQAAYKPAEGRLTPEQTYKARTIQGEQTYQRELSRKTAEDRLRDTVELPEDMVIRGVEYKKGTRIPTSVLLASQKPAVAPKVETFGNRKKQWNAETNTWDDIGPAEAKSSDQPAFKSVYDKKSKENVMASDAMIAKDPNRYSAAKATSASGEGGKPLLANEINKISDFLQGMETLKELGSKQTTGTGALAGAQAALIPNMVTEATGWGTSAKSRRAMLDTAKQIIGKAMEGGVLRKEDEAKYMKILPVIGDPPEVARAKMKNLTEQMARDSKIYLSALQHAGRDVSGMREMYTEYGYDMSEAKADPAVDKNDPEGILGGNNGAAAAGGNKFGLKKPGSK